MTPKLSLLARPWAALSSAALLALLLGSCGGKAGETYTGSGGQGSGGSKSSGGSSSSGGTKSSGGSGGMACDDGCPSIGCGQGYYSVVLPGDCCPSCVSSCDGVECPQIKCQNGSYVPDGECCATCNPVIDCTNVLCVQPDCAEGSHAEVPPGQCCPQCVTDLTCEQGKAGWQALYDTRTVELDAFSCTTNEECTVATLGSLCKFDCGTAVNTASAKTLIDELSTYGATNCATCPITDVACPPVVYFSECVENQCVLRP